MMCYVSCAQVTGVGGRLEIGFCLSTFCLFHVAKDLLSIRQLLRLRIVCEICYSPFMCTSVIDIREHCAAAPNECNDISYEIKFSCTTTVAPHPATENKHFYVHFLVDGQRRIEDQVPDRRKPSGEDWLEYFATESRWQLWIC